MSLVPSEMLAASIRYLQERVMLVMLIVTFLAVASSFWSLGRHGQAVESHKEIVRAMVDAQNARINDLVDTQNTRVSDLVDAQNQRITDLMHEVRTAQAIVMKLQAGNRPAPQPQE